MPKSNNNVAVKYKDVTGPLSIRMTNDFIFKVMLQKNKKVLKGLISSLLHLPLESITEAKIINPIVLGDAIDEKSIVLDVLVELNDNRRVNLEMQVADEKNWINRSTYYLCKNYTFLEKGKDYNDTKTIYQIGFLDFTLFNDAPEFYSTYMFTNMKTHRIYSEKLFIGIVDLSRTDLATEVDKKYNIDKWARLFKAQTWEEIKMIATQYPEINEAADTIYQISEDERIRQIYEAREDHLRRERGMVRMISEQAEEIAKLKAELAELKNNQ